jgi:hypothetical protein
MLRQQIIHCLAQVEALIDFAEGEDIEDGVYDRGNLHEFFVIIILIFVLLSSSRGHYPAFRNMETSLRQQARRTGEIWNKAGYLRPSERWKEQSIQSFRLVLKH